MSGEVRPLRGSHLLQLFASGRLLCRRQDMPDDAFFDYNALVHIRERVQDWIDTSPHAGESKAGMWTRFDADAAFLTLFAALSYRWLSREHPDPEVFHLRIIAGVIRARWTLKVAQTLAFFVKTSLAETFTNTQEWLGMLIWPLSRPARRVGG